MNLTTIKISPDMPVPDLPAGHPAPSEESLRFHIIEPARLALVDRFYRAQGYKVKCGETERVYAFSDANGDFVASARLVPQSSGHYWLRNLLVDKNSRGQGVASKLIINFLPDISPQGCYCFALTHLESFYERLGFTAQPEHCPGDILSTYHTYRNRGRDWILMGYIDS
ncbi:MAG: GNAT family N-acetyltransferase [Cellvibrio sp.]|uniref:GNAT family N-acetyltransferase n=1 Tax=Cellvibrio sp. TaxID=1965322 RepID=UPI0031AA1FBD